jgi:hypothetical protein
VDIKRDDSSQPLENRLARHLHFELVRDPNLENWLDWRHLSPPTSTAEYGVVIHNCEAYWISENRWDVFISYQTVQKDLAADLAERLRARSLRVWFDSAALRANESLTQSIDSGLGACPFGIVVLRHIQADTAISLYPGLDDKVMSTSELGMKSLSHMNTETKRRYPRRLGGAMKENQS